MIPDHPAFRYQDDATSGALEHRDGFDRCLKLACNDEAPFERAYVRERARMGRWADPRRMNWAEVQFEEHGVDVVYSNKERLPSDYARIGGNRDALLGNYLADTVETIQTAQERLDIIQRVTRGSRRAVIDGFYPGGCTPYATDKWVAEVGSHNLVQRAPERGRFHLDGCRFVLLWGKDEPDAPFRIVRELYERVAAGESLISIGAALDARKVLAPKAHAGRAIDSKWHSTTIRRIVRNPLYMGDLVWGRTTRDADPVPGTRDTELLGVEPILMREFAPGAPVSRELWQAANDVLDRNGNASTATRASRTDYLLTGLVRCALCGRAFAGFTHSHRNGRRVYRHGPERAARAIAPGYVRCAAEYKCIRAEPLEQTVLDWVARILEDGRLAQLVAEELECRRSAAVQSEQFARAAVLREKLAELETAARQAAADLVNAQAGLGRECLRQALDRASEEHLTLQKELAELEREGALLDTVESGAASLRPDTAALRRAFEAGSPDERKKIVRILVESIVVDVAAWSAEIAVRTN